MEKAMLLFMLSLGALFDYRTDKIPNWMPFFGGLLGFIIIWQQNGRQGIEQGLLGVFIIFIILCPLWFLGGIGGGDVKLMMAAGCYMGDQSWKLLIVSAICSACYSLFLMIVRKNFKKRMVLFFSYCKDVIWQGKREPYPFDKENTGDKKEGGIHVSYAILAGFVIGICTGFLTMG